MPSAIYKKVKERIMLVIRIKILNKEVEPCSYCRRNSRQCLVDSKESTRYSEYICSKRPYDSRGLKETPVVLK